jgi:hypothetical protein
MQLDGLKSNGPIRPDKTSAQRKSDPKADGKSFADVLTKAKQASRQSPGMAQVSMPAQAKAPAQPAAPSAGSLSTPERFPAGDAAASETPGAQHAETRAQQEASASEAGPSAQEYLETIRFRLKTGYYDNPKLDDALSDKLSGYFDDAAE